MTEPDIMDEIRAIERGGGATRMQRSEERLKRRIDEIQQRTSAVDGQRDMHQQAIEKAQEESHALAREAMAKMPDPNAKYAVGTVPDRLQGVPATDKAVDFILQHDLGYADGGIIAAIVKWRTAGQNLSDLMEARRLLAKLIDIESYAATNRGHT